MMHRVRLDMIVDAAQSLPKWRDLKSQRCDSVDDYSEDHGHMWESFKKIRNFKETSYLKSENDRSRLHNEERRPREFETHMAYWRQEKPKERVCMKRW